MSTVPAPIDATQTPEWTALKAHYEALQNEGISLKEWFASDPQRVEKLTFDVNDLRFDLSKNLVTDETVDLLCDPRPAPSTSRSAATRCMPAPTSTPPRIAPCCTPPCVAPPRRRAPS